MNEWNSNEVSITIAGLAGSQNLGVAVAATKRRVVNELTIRHAGTNNTVITFLVSGGSTKLTVDVPAQTTRVWSGERCFAAGEILAVQSSDITGGNTFVSASGIEA